MIGVVLQSRLDSSRLPGKALLDLKGKTVVARAMEALRGIARIDCFVLATDAESAELLAPQAAAEGFELFVGSRDDVLARYVAAIEHFALDILVRATGDNPLVSSLLADRSLDLRERAGADYAGLNGAPLGTGVEVVRAEALLAAAAAGPDEYEREHVCPYLYRRPDRFAIRRESVGEKYLFPAGRVTLDTLDDYRYIARIFDALYRGKPIGIDELVQWLRQG